MELESKNVLCHFQTYIYCYKADYTTGITVHIRAIADMQTVFMSSLNQ